jgi:tRNA pseudouridine38-40 synthase
MRLRLTIAYDGRPFAGWQSQPDGNTVQDHLEAAIAKTLQQEQRVPVHGSGRTDAGVHAMGQTAHFDVPPDCRMSPAAWRRALNVHLPPAIRVMEVAAAPDDWHARFDAAGKSYRYRIWTGSVLPPLEAGLAWHVPQRMDPAALEAACRSCEGEHDFRAFAANRGDGRDATRDTVRRLWSVLPEREGPLLTLTFHGSGFLYKMVRLLTGAIVRTARGREPLTWLERLLTAPAGEKCHYAAPADGLYLMRVDYDSALAPVPEAATHYKP